MHTPTRCGLQTVMNDRLRWPVAITSRPYTAVAPPALDLSVRIQQQTHCVAVPRLYQDHALRSALLRWSVVVSDRLPTQALQQHTARDPKIARSHIPSLHGDVQLSEGRPSGDRFMSTLLACLGLKTACCSHLQQASPPAVMQSCIAILPVIEMSHLIVAAEKRVVV